MRDYKIDRFGIVTNRDNGAKFGSLWKSEDGTWAGTAGRQVVSGWDTRRAVASWIASQPVGDDCQANLDALRSNLKLYSDYMAKLEMKGREVHPMEVMGMIEMEGEIGKAMGGWLRLSEGLLRTIDRLRGDEPMTDVDCGATRELASGEVRA